MVRLGRKKYRAFLSKPGKTSVGVSMTMSGAEAGKRQEIRQLGLQRRDRISADERRRNSDLIRENIWLLDEFRRAATVFIYVSFRSEVETLPLIRQALEQGKRVAVPVTVPEMHRLIPCLITDPAQELAPGYCGIPEPDPRKSARLEPGEIEVVVLPGSVFDLQGGRLGYGGGYYDRFLQSEAPMARRLGLAFEEQVVDRLPMLSHDQLLHGLVTEKRRLSF